MKKLIFLCVLLCSIIVQESGAQNIRFITSGEIIFERTINTHAIFLKQMKISGNDVWMEKGFDSFKKSQTQFKTLQSTLYFSNQQTLFVPKEDTAAPNAFFNSPEFKQINTVFTDLGTRMQQTRKDVFEENFLMKDTARSINWKITTETREIAGYTCRRANAIVMDSIYVVAFYTDRIPVSGGPEIFSGLPGMILGVALPHDNMTWFAKSVTDKAIDAKVMVPPAKGKATDRKGLYQTLSGALKDWGSYAKSFMKSFML